MVDRSHAADRTSAYVADTIGAGSWALAQLALGFGPGFLTAAPMLTTEGIVNYKVHFADTVHGLVKTNRKPEGFRSLRVTRINREG